MAGGLRGGMHMQSKAWLPTVLDACYIYTFWQTFGSITWNHPHGIGQATHDIFGHNQDALAAIDTIDVANGASE